MNVTSVVFWDMTSCSLVEIYRWTKYSPYSCFNEYLH